MKRKRGLPSYPGSTKRYIAIGCLSLLEAIGVTAQAIFLARAITFLFQGQVITTVILDVGYFLLAFLFRQLMALLQRRVAESFSHQLGKDLRQRLIEAYFSNGQLFIQTYGTGQLVTLAVEGIAHVKNYIELAIPRMIRVFFVPFIIVLYVFTVDKASAGILIATVPIVVIFMILLGLAAEKMADQQYETYQLLSNHFTDSLKGLETLTYLGQSGYHGKSIARVSKDYRKATNKTLRIAFLSSFALDFFTSLSIAFVAVGLGFRLIDGAITLLPALTILILAPEYFLPIRQVGLDYHATLDGQVALEEIEQMTQTKHNDLTANETSEEITWDTSSSLLVENVCIKYDNQPVLKDISFSWSGQGMIGLIGPSGAGKSTLIHTLAGFIDPVDGSVVINDSPTTTLKRADWLNQIAYIPQQPYIFPLSLADNIRFYERVTSDAEIEQVIQDIGMQSFVNELPQGIHEPIGEGGRTLSGGQEQRVAIARALVSKRPIILLDEPTAHLDIETEYELKQLMLRLFKNKLVFFATHRMHWMKHMDYILVLDDGKLVEQGTPQQLIAQQGDFYQLMAWLDERRDRR